MVTRISVVSKSNQNTESNVLKKRKRMFWTIELNDLLINLMQKCTSNSEIASYFMLQSKELNLTFDQVTQHIRKLKQGKIKITTKEQENECSEIKKDNKINHDDGIRNEKRSYTKWKEWDESMKIIFNEPNNSTLATKAKLFVGKYPTLQKSSEQILGRMKFISSRVVKTTKRNKNSTNNRAIKKNKTKNTKKTPVLIYKDIVLDTPIYPCVCCERLNFLSKSTLINEKAINQTNNLLQCELKLIEEKDLYVCHFC